MGDFYKGAKKRLSGFVSRLFRLRVTGGENEPETGGMLVCCNHTSMLDVIALGAAFRRPLRYMAKKELFRVPIIAPLIRALGAFPVDRGGADVASIRRTVALLGEGELVGIFPQGHRYPGVDPATTPVKSGAGMLAYRAKADILPVFIRTKGMKTRLFRRTEVIIGEPIRYAELGFESGGSAEYERAARIVFDRICALGSTPQP